MPNMAATVTAIYRYPVKGLSAEKLGRVALTPGEGLPHGGGGWRDRSGRCAAGAVWVVTKPSDALLGQPSSRWPAQRVGR